MLSLGSAASAGVTASERYRRYERDELIYADGDRVTSWYEVVEGVVRTSHYHTDGFRQISGFFYPGDFAGVHQDTHVDTAEAVGAVILRLIDPNQLDRLAPITKALICVVRNLRDYVSLLGQTSAIGRMAAFLLATERRSKLRAEVDLPMSRLDVADHLGLSVHTVSRATSELVRRRLIARSGRCKIRILDVAGLRHVAQAHGENLRQSATAETPVEWRQPAPCLPDEIGLFGPKRSID